MQRSCQRPSATLNGFSWIEIVLVVALLAMLASVGMTAFLGQSERRDAEAVMSAQTVLQSIVTQGATRLDKKPSAFTDGDFHSVLVASRHALGYRSNTAAITLIKLGNREFKIIIPTSQREAQFMVNDNGVVELKSLTRFANYTIDAHSKTLTKD